MAVRYSPSALPFAYRSKRESLEIPKVALITMHCTPLEIVFGGPGGYLNAICELETALYQMAA